MNIVGSAEFNIRSTVSLAKISALRAAVESILLVLDDPASASDIARAVGATEEETLAIIEEWKAELDQRGSGIDLRDVGGGWRLYTRAEHAPAVEAFLLDGTQSKLSRAALETLAVVAYRQPVTRSQVAAVRGVNCDGVIRTLTLRGLVKEVGHDETSGAHLYETTELFLETMGLSDVSELPDLAPLLPDVDSIDELDTPY
ncbi:SMC-Scp complex subunit ScpB [Corynebacterium kroppenstedtii]|uniref:SMC-Scp complex subunit ScpB n=1 Tax=Corynebacterium sp. PCR 32 TaxID=3351342 RepID=UPI003750CDDA